MEYEPNYFNFITNHSIVLSDEFFKFSYWFEHFDFVMKMWKFVIFQKHDFQELSNDDYFLKNNEFATWLKEEKRVFFSDLSSESAREMFTDFVKAWNDQKLESKYYEGIANGPRSSHQWRIKEWKHQQQFILAFVLFSLFACWGLQSS